MKLHYKGKYNLDVESLPESGHEPNAVKYKEVDNTTDLAKIATVISLFAMIGFLVLYIVRWGFYYHDFDIILSDMYMFFIGSLVSLFFIIPHELLHAVCFKGDVYMYMNLKQGMAFVVCTDRISKWHFNFMSILPTLILGIIPFIIGMIWYIPILAYFGIANISSGAGDFYNIFNTLTQVPKGAKVYMYKMNTYWYLPEKGGKE